MIASQQAGNVFPGEGMGIRMQDLLEVQSVFEFLPCTLKDVESKVVGEGESAFRIYFKNDLGQIQEHLPVFDFFRVVSPLQSRT